MKSKWFRYGFLIFFFIMFFQMLWNTYLVFAGTRELKQVVTLLWTFKLPWQCAYHGTLFHPGVAQFAFGFYSVMLTSTVLGLITMVLFKPRSWCVYCPMGTMIQLICKAKNGKGRSVIKSPFSFFADQLSGIRTLILAVWEDWFLPEQNLFSRCAAASLSEQN